MVITGTSRGVGQGIAGHFLDQGYLVFGCSRGPSSIEQEGYEHSIVDITDDDQVRQWITSISRAHGRIDVVINNAGLMPPASLAMATPTDLVEATFKTNLLGAFAICRESAKAMMRRKSGRIINISTVATALHLEGASAYLASKVALVEFSKVLAKELVPLGITCNVLSLSLLESEMSDSLNEAALANYTQSFAIKEPSDINDVCNVISFFVSPASRHVTGQVLHLGYVD